MKVESSGGGTHLEATSRLNSDADELLSAAIAVTGNEMTLTFTRPGGTLVRQYSVVTGAPTELRLYDPSSQSLESFTPQ